MEFQVKVVDGVTDNTVCESYEEAWNRYQNPLPLGIGRFSQEYIANMDNYRYEVGEFEWITPEPENNNKRLKIEEAAEEYILYAASL